MVVALLYKNARGFGGAQLGGVRSSVVEHVNLRFINKIKHPSTNKAFKRLRLII